MKYALVLISKGAAVHCYCQVPIGNVITYMYVAYHSDINEAFKFANIYNSNRHSCQCRVEVKEV